MMRRPRWFVAGMAVGAGGTLWVERRARRRLDRLAAMVAPGQVTASAAASVRQAGTRLRAAATAAVEERARREAELWSVLDGRAGDDGSYGPPSVASGSGRRAARPQGPRGRHRVAR